MDFGFIWILFLAFLGIPAVICFLLVSKINALGDSLDTIHEEISALQQMMRENRKKKKGNRLDRHRMQRWKSRYGRQRKFRQNRSGSLRRRLR